jgi:hypothetical protein
MTIPYSTRVTMNKVTRIENRRPMKKRRSGGMGRYLLALEKVE